jgi:hypothetical protein
MPLGLKVPLVLASATRSRRGFFLWAASLAAASFPTRRFPPPWTLEENNDACFIVKDATGALTQDGHDDD